MFPRKVLGQQTETKAEALGGKTAFTIWSRSSHSAEKINDKKPGKAHLQKKEGKGGREERREEGGREREKGERREGGKRKRKRKKDGERKERTRKNPANVTGKGCASR